MAIPIVLGVVAITSSAVAYSASKQAGEAAEAQAEAQARAAETAAQQAQLRAEQEAQLEKERVAYEANLARENAAYEISIAEENAQFTIGQKTKEYRKVQAAQIAGSMAAGLNIGGSTWAVMERTNEEHQTDVGEVKRALDIFSTTRTREAEQVAEGGEFGLSQFLARNTRETKFEIENRSLEASMFRMKGSAAKTQSRYAQYGALLSGASGVIGAYGMSKLSPSQQYGILARG